MEHLTVEEIHDLAVRVDRGDLPKEALPAHVTMCRECMQEFRFQAVLVNTLRTHIHPAPRSMKKAVMNRIIPSGDTVFTKILSAGGRALAMVAVVAVIVYGLSLELPGSSRPSPTSELFGQMSSYYNVAKEFLSAHTSALGAPRTDGGEKVKILVMTFVVLAGLGLIDKILGRRFVRMKL
ncbi:MAG: hypothetical protein HBSIN02_01850 [Bacteroidia bacterium]|nr:MAG: hypothetical protein HBSIN02_01850 [Bacteroidia bacterium]